MQVRNKLDDLYDEFVNRYGQTLTPFLNPVLTIIRWILIYFFPAIMGSIGKEVYASIFKVSSFQEFILIERNQILQLFILIGFFLLGVAWSRHESTLTYYEVIVYSLLGWIYQDLGFADNRDYDVRCTIWVRHSPRKKPDIKRLKQLVDYYPPRGEKLGRKFRPNKRSGRVFSVCRKIGDEELAIGILGYCTMASMNEQSAKIMHEEISEDVEFIEHMVTNWNFTERQARRLTQDRHSYMCLSIMTRDCSELMGIIYCDSVYRYAFPTEIDTKFEKYLPRVAKALNMKTGDII